jgi:hypothetical protein
VRSSACGDVNIWSGNEKERSCWRDGRGIREIEEKVGEKMAEKMGEKLGEKMGEKLSEKMGEKMGGKVEEERCEGERERSPRQNAQRDENNLLKYFKSPHLSVWL